MTHDQERDDEPYLWDRSGPPDPEVARLEKLLAPLALGDPPPLPAAAPAPAPKRAWVPMSMAAVVLLVGGLGVWWYVGRGETGEPMIASTDADAGGGGGELAMCTADEVDGPALRYQVVTGQTACGGGAAREGWLPVGAWLETDAETRIDVEVANLGQVSLDPGSRLRVKAVRPEEHRLELARGALEAVISAPPRIFFVDTPAATAVDLGCRYRLEVDERGAGVLHVTTGWVALERGDQSSLVPQGASCEIDAVLGPGTPFASGAGAALRDPLRRFDFAGDTAAIDQVIAAAGPADTLTLWHLLGRVDPARRCAIHDKLVALAGPAPGADRDAVACGTDDALAAWREKLEPLWLFGVVPAPPPGGKQLPGGKSPPHPWGGKDMKTP